MSVKIITDSTSYIPENIKKELDISILSLNISFDTEEYKEIELKNETFYKKMEEYDELPKSSQPSIKDFYTAFEEIVIAGHEIVGVFLSSKMSGTYSTALMVKNMILENYPEAKIEIVDSTSNSMQLGFAAITGAKLAKEGKNIEEIVSEINKNIKRSKFIFIPDDFKYLKKGGRVGTAQAIIGSVLKIKPILTVINGKTAVLEKIRTRKKAIEKMIDIFAKDIEKYGFGDAVVHHINCEEEALKLADLLKETTGKIIKIVPIGPVIGTHVGPGSIGIAYFTKETLNS
ncbi:hypothetical protein OSSY52_03330 [Tepiditoga spiralis]|uniref:Fatty acid-binding protein DegV n=1 Tax=Tepiditoga spiralis TaxID=2108365 RepID=A0A7G1G845_9BACT|nr:DegV family protein [Tepiditoga spiralis]BBE30192.1 hypothetical protein OSSY52_03330 [Tepiditoga spiralis]